MRMAHVLPVIASAAKQSSQALASHAVDCRVAALLAMTNGKI